MEKIDNISYERKLVDYVQPRSWRTWLIGRPLVTADAPHQTIGKLVGLAVFASDALSSTAYATQEILGVLAVAGSGALGYAFPISMAIAALLIIVAISYEQTIHAYSGGGGAYIVARDNLGELPALTAGAALLTDYVLTVAVSVSSGVDQMISAFPTLAPYKVIFSVSLVFMVMFVNLRGVRESGNTFAIPTYFFLTMISITVITGLVRIATGSLGMLIDPPPMPEVELLAPVTPFLILHAFSNGTTALTGIEAISNGITAFKEPRSKNAGITLIWMAGILTFLFIGITFLSGHIGAVFSESETVISQLTRTVFSGRGFLYLATLFSTTTILIMASNTSFADFPRLSALLAKDGFIPRQFTYRGSRLVYSRGIMALALLAIFLIVVFKASVTRLIPLYAIGVFLSFTLSQSGMALRWWKSGHLKRNVEINEPGSILKYDSAWKRKMIVNSIGAVATAIVVIVFAITKFTEGAWIILILAPALVMVFSAIHIHYKSLAQQLSLDNYGAPPLPSRHRVLLLISGVHRGSLAALNYARSLSIDITAIHVSSDPDEAERIRQKWSMWGDGVRLVILESPYRLLVEPILRYIETISSFSQPNEVITVVVPQFVPKHWYHNILHTQTAVILRAALFFRKRVVVIDVPYQVE